MPTKRSKPQWNIDRPGYTPLKPLYSPSQVTELAALLGREPEEIQKPLTLAALEFGPYMSQREAKKPEQLAGLRSIATDTQGALRKLEVLDSRSKLLLLYEYGRPIDDDEYNEDSLLALEHLKQDVAGLNRLHQNLAVAVLRLLNRLQDDEDDKNQLKPGRPTKSFEYLAARKLLDVCKMVVGEAFLQPRSAERRVARRFAVAALIMVGVSQATAAGAVTRVLAGERKKSPHRPG